MNVSLVKNKTPRKAREGALISFSLKQCFCCSFFYVIFVSTSLKKKKKVPQPRVATQQKMFQLVL